MNANICNTQEQRHQVPKIVTYQEAADILRCSLRTIYRLIAAGTIKPLRLGSAVRIDIMEAIKALRCAGEADAQ